MWKYIELYRNIYKHIEKYRKLLEAIADSGGLAGDLIFLTPIVPKSSRKKTSLALHAAKIIWGRFFLVWPTVPNKNICTSKYNIRTNETTHVFSENNENHKSNNNYRCFKAFVPYGSHTVNQKI